MTSFEKAIINELKGINKELHELNKKKSEAGKIDGQTLDSEMDQQIAIKDIQS